jgi:hypothetical protein
MLKNLSYYLLSALFFLFFNKKALLKALPFNQEEPLGLLLYLPVILPLLGLTTASI